MRNHFLNNPQPTSQQVRTPDAQHDDGGHKQSQCFAIVKALKIRFIQKGISENAFWCWALGSQGKEVIGSRSQFEVLDWTILAARLQTAQTHQNMFDVLCKQIVTQGNCRVYRINPDLSETKVHEGLFEKSVYERCKRHADATGCTVKLHAYGECEAFEPKERKLDGNTPPIIDTEKGSLELPDGRGIHAADILVLSMPCRHTAGDMEWYDVDMVMSKHYPKSHISARFDTRQQANEFYQRARNKRGH